MSLGLGPKFKLVTSQQPAAKIKEKTKMKLQFQLNDKTPSTHTPKKKIREKKN